MKRAIAYSLCVVATLWFSGSAFAQQLRRQVAFEVRQSGGRVTCNRAAPMDVSAEAIASLHVINPHVNATGMTIILRGTTQLDSYPAAKAAFSRAADEWEQYLTNPITIYIDVDYGPQRFGKPYASADVLGSTGSDERTTTFSNIRSALLTAATRQYQQDLYKQLPSSSLPTDLGPTSSVDINQAELRAIGLMPATASATDTSAAQIGFNSSHTFDFDNSDGVSSGAIDFQSVAAHEIGHGLGFGSDVGWTELSSSVTLAATPLDFFRFRPGAGSSFSSANRVLSSGGDQNFYNGLWESALSTGRPDGTGGDEQQASHWKEWQISGHYIGLMNPTLGTRTVAYITIDDLVAFNLLGYSINLPSPPNAPSNLTATTDGGTLITTSWQDNSNNESEFRLEASVNSSPYIELGGIPANTTRVSFNGSSNTVYKFRIFATNAGGPSAYSNETSITTGSGATPPPSGPCVANSTTACVLNNRFKVTVRYRGAFDNNAADTDALVKQVSGFASSSFETVFFYFNSPNNIEMLLKMLDQGNTNSAGQPTIAVLFGSATPLRMELTITDTTNGSVKRYTSAFATQAGSTDFTAFVK